MLKKLLFILLIIPTLFLCTNAYAAVHAGEGAKLYYVESVTEADIFGAEGDTITYNRYVECDSSYTGEICAGAYVYNDSLTNGDCVEMLIMLVEYSDDNCQKFEKLYLKRVHACPGDNGKLVCTDPISVDSSHSVKAMIWGETQVIPYGPSSGR